MGTEQGCGACALLFSCFLENNGLPLSRSLEDLNISNSGTFLSGLGFLSLNPTINICYASQGAAKRNSNIKELEYLNLHRQSY